MSNLLDKLNKHVQNKDALKWEGSLEDYIKLIIEKPKLHMGAHKRILSMIESYGVEQAEDETAKYKFFDSELFGVEESIEDFMSYLRAAASGSEVSRRMLLLYGPTSSGKSQLAIMLKRGLEEFSKTDDGAIFRLKDSPMSEDPLIAVPHELRGQFFNDYGIKIDGELSPIMALTLKEKYDNNFLSLPVERYTFSEAGRRGIGCFVPGDKKSQDLSELIGSLDLSTIGTYGAESDPRAYRFDGELNIANRGMMEFIEMLKVDHKFLYVLLTLAQEKNIKTPRFPLIFADEFVLGHTNFVEYQRFLAKDEMEALHDRMIVVKVPYNLSLSNEVKIYEKLVKQASFGSIHIAPHTLRCAAMFAVLSRYLESENKTMTLMNKLKLYDGQEVEGFSKNEVPKFKHEFKEEGMNGISPRYVVNRISTTITDTNTKTITPIDMIRSLRAGLKSNPKIDEKELERLSSIFPYVIDEYNKLAKNDVQKAFFVNFEQEIQNLLRNYLEQVEAFLDGSKLRDEWGNVVDPNERLMRSIEEKIQVTESGKKSFRQEIYRKMLKSQKEGGKYDYSAHSQLREALEKQLFEERSQIINLTISTRNPDDEALRKINVVIDTLCKDYGYNVDSANQLLKYVSSLMARN